MNILSLYDGMACGRIALDRADIKVDRYVAFENDPIPKYVSIKNYPHIEHYNDVFDGNYVDFEGFDLLIGGSPCTHWSTARTRGGRETENSGIGWELFLQYVRALNESKCQYFLYENNYSISSLIKKSITDKLGVEPIMINSNLISAQDRKRMYWTNIPNVTLPQDKQIYFNEIISKERIWFNLLPWCLKKWGDKIKVDTLRTLDSKKSFCVTTGKTHPKNYYLNSDRTKMTKLTANEIELLQTVPSGYTKFVPEGKRFKMLGNGWTVDVIAHIFSFIPR